MTNMTRYDRWVAGPREFGMVDDKRNAWQAACDAAIADLLAMRKKYEARGQLAKAQGVTQAIAAIRRVRHDRPVKADSL